MFNLKNLIFSLSSSSSSHSSIGRATDLQLVVTPNSHKKVKIRTQNSCPTDVLLLDQKDSKKRQ